MLETVLSHLKCNLVKRNFSVSWFKDEQVEESKGFPLNKEGRASVDWRSGNTSLFPEESGELDACKIPKQVIK